jgi:hypothetical protein
MAANLALRSQDAPALTREEVIVRYRHLRAISRRHNAGAMKFLSRDAMMEQARRLGLMRARTLILDDMDEMVLVFDLAIYTAPLGRSRPIDRYAQATPFAAGSDEALVLDAMRNACFALVVVERRHPAAGLIVIDPIRDTEVWLVDEGHEASLRPGTLLATRYYAPDGFAMTAGIGIPVDPDMAQDAFELMPRHLREKPLREAIDDRRYAEVVYRVALAEGAMERTRFQEVPGPDGAD